MPAFSIRPKRDEDTEWVADVFRAGGAEFVVSRGRTWYPARLPGFVAADTAGCPVGLATYRLEDDQCELVTLDAFERLTGIGTALLNAVAETARQAGCRRLWLITTNDNLDAIRFYQRRGLRLVAVHADAIAESRRLKPSIPRIGTYDIPIRDELEFELPL